MITISQAWAIYQNAPSQICKWEHTDAEYIKQWGHAGGLLLNGCPHCGEFQTRETYVQGFWAENIELVTDYVCKGVSKCKCGKWSKWTV